MKVLNLKFHNRKDMDISVKFGFIGVGLMGCRVVDTISQLTKDGKQLYSTLGININKGDLDAQKNLKNKLLLESKYKAAGRNPEIGYEALAENEERVKKAIADVAYESNFIWFVTGLGGGTGTGAILQMIEWAEDLKYMNVDFGIIVSIPREIDGYTENKNALLVLEQLNEVAANREIPIIVVDNELLFNRYVERRKDENIAKEWTEHSNGEIASLLHQINIITTFTPYASKHFDEEEFRLVIKAGGCIQFAKTVLNIKDLKDPIAVKNTLQKNMEDGLASSGYNISDSSMIGISVFAPASNIVEVFDISNIEVLENAVNEIAPKAEVRWGQYVDYNTTAPKIEIYSIISGLSLPKRVEEFPEILKRTKPSTTAKKLQLDLSVIDMPEEKSTEKKIVNPFKKQAAQAKKEVAATKEAKIPDWLKMK